MLRVAIVEDSTISSDHALLAAFIKAGFSVTARDSTSTIIRNGEAEQYHCILLPLNEPDQLKSAVSEILDSLNPPIVLVYGNSDYESVIQGMTSGAYDYISTTQATDEIALQLEKITVRLKTYPARPLVQTVQPKKIESDIIFSNLQMREIIEITHRLAPFGTTVLITGESGTGKELVAKQIHALSPRSSKPFIAINCGAIPESLMESELFGHKKGAFTDASRDKRGLFEEADGGTLFLDEIGELPLHLQVKLLRTLQERQIRRVGDEHLIPINVRVVAATLRDLQADVLDGRFRDDLFYRLNVVSIPIPPLRERRDEIPALAKHFLTKHNRRLSLTVTGITEDAMACMVAYWWRGNVRELENCIERAMVLTTGKKIDVASLPPHIRGEKLTQSEVGSQTIMQLDSLSIKEKTKELETVLIAKALDKTGGNRTKAAKILEISHRALLYKLKEYQIT